MELGLVRTVWLQSAAADHDRPALVDSDDTSRTLTHGELSSRVADAAATLPPAATGRRLVQVPLTAEVDVIVGYLAVLLAGHVALVTSGRADTITAHYRPDLRLRRDGRFDTVSRHPQHLLHPDLALLLSTSGSTGSPKLVRLSHDNVASNAESIAEYLSISAADRSATTMPMFYCYGLSVINSHLLRGAGLVLTDLSVVDPCFWELFRRHEATAFAAVPYTFELLERVGFADMELPKLRYVTQAGGRLAPADVQRYSELGQRRGWDLFVMYGQTEATARMAYLPPRLAADNPGTIGMAVPGGSFRIDPVPGLEHGELVYSGPNVMLGYAEHPEDLAAGRTVGELRTGDLARKHPNGLY